jgi:hypothetical protein
MATLSEEFVAGPARLRVDVTGDNPPEHILQDLNFMNYRLANVTIEPGATLSRPDIIWNMVGEQSISYDGHAITLNGPWGPGPLQKCIVAMLALRLDALGLHPSHSSAVRYKGKTILFLGGESNHGKSMCQIEANRRGALLISTETTIIDENAFIVAGSHDVFLKKRVAGTERSDKAAPEAGVKKFFGDMPTWEIFDESSVVDVVIVPSIDGNYETALSELVPFEKQFQGFHSFQNYFLTNELLAPGWPMPSLEGDQARQKRATFVEKFSDRPFYFVRAGEPRSLMDEVEKVL